MWVYPNRSMLIGAVMGTYVGWAFVSSLAGEGIHSVAIPWGTIAVVWTTITITVLKVFDIVLSMTNGQWRTQVLANLMFDWMFRGGGDFGRGAAIAIVIMVVNLVVDLTYGLINPRVRAR